MIELPAVTKEPSSSSSVSPSARISFSIGGGDDAGVQTPPYKSRSNTINTLETLSETETDDRLLEQRSGVEQHSGVEQRSGVEQHSGVEQRSGVEQHNTKQHCVKHDNMAQHNTELSSVSVDQHNRDSIKSTAPDSHQHNHTNSTSGVVDAVHSTTADTTAQCDSTLHSNKIQVKVEIVKEFVEDDCSASASCVLNRRTTDLTANHVGMCSSSDGKIVSLTDARDAEVAGNADADAAGDADAGDTDADADAADRFKQRSVSSPSDRSKRMHPRTTSDPRGMSAERLDSQAAVHFKDADLRAKLIDKSILRNKHRGSGGGGNSSAETSAGTGDTGVSSMSEPSSSASASFSPPHRHQRHQAASHHDKSRSSSVNTDTSGVNTSDTSGVSSVGSSGPHGGMTEQPSLSTIPSSGSLHSADVRKSSTVSTNSDNTVHHSDIKRRSVNLKRVPNAKRRFSNPVLTPILKTLQRDSDVVSEYTLSYTSSRDVHGYATLRELKRYQRPEQPDVDKDSRIFRSLNDAVKAPLAKTHSLDFRSLTRLRCVRVRRKSDRSPILKTAKSARVNLSVWFVDVARVVTYEYTCTSCTPPHSACFYQNLVRLSAMDRAGHGAAVSQ